LDLEEQYAKICLDVLSKIKPKSKEKNAINAVYRDISSKINEVLTKKEIKAELELSGSFSRDTWLTKDRDIDIFIILPYDSKYRPEEIISLIKKQIDLPWEKRHANHPYLYSVKDGVEIEIIPCYQYEPKRKIKSAVDRSPKHKEFVVNNLPTGANEEVRLLKQFMKGIDVYGAEIKIQGFSGYLVELLIIYYQGQFLEVIQNAKALLKTSIAFSEIDDEIISKQFHNDAVIVIDPVDYNRNVASAVSFESITKFVAAAELFLTNPKMEFFFPKELTITKKILSEIKASSIYYTAIIHKLPNVVADILWGQIRKLESSLFGYLTSQGIYPLKIDTIVRNEKIITVVISEHRFTPDQIWILGPPIDITSSEKFLEKYQDKPSVIYGPEIINGRWQALQKTEKIRIDALIKKAYSEKLVTTPSHLSLSLAKIKILHQDEFLNDLSTDHKTLTFLYYLVKGKPRYMY